MTCCNQNCRQGRDCPHRKSRVSYPGAAVMIILGVGGLFLWVELIQLFWRML